MRSLVYLIKFLSKIPRKCEVKMIEFYQKYISPGLGNHCKFYPTCSEYAKQAIDKYGIIKGNILTIYKRRRRRIFNTEVYPRIRQRRRIYQTRK